MSVENEIADGGRDGRTCLTRPNSCEQEFRLVVEVEHPETGRDGEPVSRDQILKHEQGIRLSVENKHADGGRDGRTCLARPNCQALTGIQDECGE